MPRLTITISDEHHLALEEAAARHHTSIRAIIEESLELAGIKTGHRAADIVASARRAADLVEASAMSIAVQETRETRRGRSSPLSSSTPPWSWVAS